VAGGIRLAQVAVALAALCLLPLAFRLNGRRPGQAGSRVCLLYSPFWQRGEGCAEHPEAGALVSLAVSGPSGTQQGGALQALLAGIAPLQTQGDHAGEVLGVISDTAEAA
jgi:hypothetical protein